MRIQEILFWNNVQRSHSDPELHLRRNQSSNDLTNLATAFTKNGLVKYLWNPKGSEEQPSAPAPPGAEPELIPSGGTLEPTMALAQAEPVKEEPPVGLHRLVPFRPYRGASG